MSKAYAVSGLVRADQSVFESDPVSKGAEIIPFNLSQLPPDDTDVELFDELIDLPDDIVDEDDLLLDDDWSGLEPEEMTSEAAGIEDDLWDVQCLGLPDAAWSLPVDRYFDREQPD